MFLRLHLHAFCIAGLIFYKGGRRVENKAEVTLINALRRVKILQAIHELLETKEDEIVEFFVHDDDTTLVEIDDKRYVPTAKGWIS